MKIDIGGGNMGKEGYKTVDIVDTADYVCNLEIDRLPFEDNSVDEIFTHSTLEHIKNLTHVMNEMWRVLKWGGKLEIIVPHKDCAAAYQDPTHVRFFNTEVMKFYEGWYINKWKLKYSDLIKCAFKNLNTKVEIVRQTPRSHEYFEGDTPHLKEITWKLEKSREYAAKNRPFYISDDAEGWQ